MKKPSKKQITDFIKKEFPHIYFDGVIFEETSEDRCWFKVISCGRMIAQADYQLTDSFYEKVKNHLKWCFG